MTEHIVPAYVSDTPLATYLKRAYPALPGWALRDALKKRDVRVNGTRAGSDWTVRAGDQLKIYIDDKYLSGNLTVLFEDADFLFLEKEPGLPVDADEAGIGADTLLSRAQARYPGAALCHRLDVYTGGVILLAKNEKARAQALDAFREHKVEKRYQCLCKGIVSPPTRILKGYLRKDAAASRVTVTDSPAKGALPIETHVQLLKKGENVSLCEVELITGRTHQIRAHMAHIGHPLLGDDKYGDRALNRQLSVRYPALWCVSLAVLGRSAQSKARLPDTI